ncbi:choice-of-anchor M domain-containing protein [Dactylosporangium siamense]|uniref:choice-of-anchor M domain-containing protein n=1 Tax=Dactylosporangium siamense TaxID=685454 RepID=UPI0019423590|nr:choice-of-anchor M domain-containing protein [Dactylosporangium siamense]
MLSLLAGTSGPAVAAPTPAGGAVILAAGHADLGPRLVDGAWRIQVRDDTVRPPAWRGLDEIVVHAADATRAQVPATAEFAFLGTAGSDVWILPQVQRPDAVWLGWSTQDPTVATTIQREMTWRVHQVTGPGRFALFLNGNFGAPQVVFDSGKPMPQDSGVEADTHVHGNWVFTAPGAYRIDVEMTAASKAGERLSGRGTLRVHVGPGDPAAVFPPAPSPATNASTGPATAEGTHSSGPDRAWLWPAIGSGVLLALLTVWIVRRRIRRSEP